MSEPVDAHTPGPHSGQPDSAGEEIDALPVPVEGETVVATWRNGGPVADGRTGPTMLPAVQAAAVAAGGFVAGAAVAGLVHRRRRRSAALSAGRRSAAELGRGGRPARRAAELVQIVGSRSLLVDVHLLGSPGADG